MEEVDDELFGLSEADRLCDVLRELSTTASGAPSGLNGVVIADGLARLNELSAVGRVDLLASIARMQSWLAAARALAIAGFTGGLPGRNKADRARREEAAAVLSVSPRAMAHQAGRAQLLTGHLPKVLDALKTGVLSPEQANAVVVGSHYLPSDTLDEFQDLVLEDAAEQTVQELARTVEQARICVDPSGAEARRQQAIEDRDVTTRSSKDGMGVLNVLGDAELIANVIAGLNSLASQLPKEDPRTKAQQRADLLGDILLSALRDGNLPTAQGRQPVQTVIHMTLASLFGSTDEAAWIDGYGPITAPQAREMVMRPGSVWWRLVTDPVTKHLADHELKRYEWTAADTRMLLAKHLECSFPGCTRPAFYCDLDHVIPYGVQGGPTCASCNGAPVCRKHHLLKTHGQPASEDERGHPPFFYVLNPDGSTTWQVTTGKTYTSRPPRIGRNLRSNKLTWQQQNQQLNDTIREDREFRKHLAYEEAFAAINADYRYATKLGHRAAKRRARKALRALVRERQRQLARQKTEAAGRRQARDARRQYETQQRTHQAELDAYSEAVHRKCIDLPADAPAPF